MMSGADGGGMPDLGEIDIGVSEEGPTTVVSVAGEIDLVTAPRLRNMLSRVLDREGLSLVVLDMASVTFLDSTGLGALAFANKRSEEAGQVMRLCCIHDNVRRILDL